MTKLEIFYVRFSALRFNGGLICWRTLENLIPVELIVVMSVSALCDEETHQTMIAIAMTGWLYRSITVPTCIFGLRVRHKKYYFGFVSA